MKRSKSSVNYSSGMRNERCGLCKHYDGEGGCSKVEGSIGAWMWCKLYERKRSSG